MIGNSFFFRLVSGILSAAGLFMVFLFQKTDIAELLGITNTSTGQFLVNRMIRFCLNDLFAIGMIYALFLERKYLIFAIWVQFAGVVLFLTPYFFVKVYYPSFDGPLISYLHRLVLNPTLLLLLIPAFYYQELMSRAAQNPKVR